jgi:uncharacterized phage protein gp47/JayE
MSGVSTKGFSLKRFRTILEDMEEEAVSQYGSSISTDTNSVLGRALRVVTPSLTDLWETSEEVYSSFSPEKATGVSLDALAALAGLTRFLPKPTTSPVILTADYETFLPDDSAMASTFTNQRYTLKDSVYFGLEGITGLQIEPVDAVAGLDYYLYYGDSKVSYTASAGDTEADIARELSTLVDGTSTFNSNVLEDDDKVAQFRTKDTFQSVDFRLSPHLVARSVEKVSTAVSTEDGEYNQPPGTINKVAAPVKGWTGVNNPVKASLGRLGETDAELRERFKMSKESRASNTLEAIYSDILGVQDIEEVVVYENDTGEENERGFPEHSITTVAEGGSSLEIANIIWRNKPAGIQTFGNTTVTIVDSQGFNQDINFIRPVEVPVYVDLEIKALEGFPSSGDEDIKQAIVDYIDDKYSIGDRVIYSRLYTPINSVHNHEIESMFIGTSPSPKSTGNINSNFDEIPRSATSYINVKVT